MTTHLDDTQGLDQILEQFVKRVENIPRGKTYGWGDEKQAILHWVDMEVIGEFESLAGEQIKNGRIYRLGDPQGDAQDRLREQQRATLIHHGYKQNTKEASDE